MYRCPFCGLYIRHGIQWLNEHRETGGECDQMMEMIQAELDESAEENAS